MSEATDIRIPDRTKSSSHRKYDIKRHMRNKWRQETFNKKLKLEKWEEKRQKAALRKYYKQLRKEDPGKKHIHPADKRCHTKEHIETKTCFFTEEKDKAVIVTQNTDRHDGVVLPHKQKQSAFKRALQAFENQQEEREAKAKIMQQKIAEKKEKLKMNKKQRTENFKKLSMKTAQGQPVMAGRIQMLLDKIEKDLKRTTNTS